MLDLIYFLKFLSIFWNNLINKKINHLQCISFPFDWKRKNLKQSFVTFVLKMKIQLFFNLSTFLLLKADFHTRLQIVSVTLDIAFYLFKEVSFSIIWPEFLTT